MVRNNIYDNNICPKNVPILKNLQVCQEKGKKVKLFSQKDSLIYIFKKYMFYF